MTTNNNIQEAIKMIDSHDWNWRYADYGYESRCSAAKRSMRTFVKYVKTIDDSKVRETLRSMWIMRFHDQIDDYLERKAELLSNYAA